MDWAKAVLILLQLANSIASWLREKQAMDAGADRAIAEAAGEVLKRSAFAHEVSSRICTLSNKDLDALADRLGE